MSKKLREVLQLLEYDELVRMKQDLKRGGDGVSIIVDNRLREEVQKLNEFCAVCASKIDPESRTKITVELGPGDLMKKATFCAVDCLEYFISEMKKVQSHNE